MPGVPAARVVVIGAGVVGTNALQMAVGIGAGVTVIDRNVDRLRALDLIYGNRISTLYSTAHTIEAAVLRADLVIGAVLVPGAAAPKLVTREMLGRMKRGAVLVDVAIDQGGCFETSQPDHPRRRRPTWSTASSTTAWPTCRARWRAPRPLP